MAGSAGRVDAAGDIGLRACDHRSPYGWRLPNCPALVRKLEVEQPQLEKPTSPLGGVEINAGFGIEVHILGYAFDPHTLPCALSPKQAASGDDYQAANVIAAIHQAGD